MAKLIAVSGVQASGVLHIGNYIGAIKQFVEMGGSHQLFIFVADLHAITVPQNPKELKKNTLSTAALYLACGLDPKKTTLFVQSHVPEHTELGWILTTLAPVGELERMTQYKEKKEIRGVLAGLLTYPVLMAADILLYQADEVPVGEDQVQHLELTRELARKFNTKFGETFKEPKPLLKKKSARIMGLDDPSQKMSKSASSKANFISLLDSPENIRHKIRSAVTDSGKNIAYDPASKPAISNLLTIFSELTNSPVEELEKHFSRKSYAEFKEDLAEVIVKFLEPIQKKHGELISDEAGLKKILAAGDNNAKKIAQTTMAEVRQKIGLLPHN